MSRIPRPAQTSRASTRINVRDQPQACFHHQQKEPSLSLEVVKLARKSGQLNLAGRGMIEVPDIVWNINSLTREEIHNLSVSLDQCDGDRWWDQTELVKLYLSSNRLSILSSAIEQLRFLVILELHDNQLTSLPVTIGKLQNLCRLTLSHNKIEEFPKSFYELKELRTLIAHHNEIKTLGEDVGNLNFLEHLDLSYNQLIKVPANIGFLSRISNLNLAHNKLVELPPDVGSMDGLQVLDVSYNNLKDIPEQIGSLCHLEQLYIQQNAITHLTTFHGCPKLKELHAGDNNINDFPPEIIESLLFLKVLELRNNKIEVLHPDITMLQGLERLDLTNNSISSLPYTLGIMSHLKSLNVDGNPLRAIRRDIVKRGTVHLLKWLQDHIEEPPGTPKSRPSSAGGDGSDLLQSIEKFTLKSTHSLDCSNRGLKDVPKELFEMAAEAEVSIVDLSKNQFTSIPERLEAVIPKLVELNLGFNRLQEIPTYLCFAKHLTYLDIRNNQLSDLPRDLQMLSSLRELNLSFNRFVHIPEVVSELLSLEILFASDNQIQEIDSGKLQQLTRLAALDLRNNSIGQVPPELGNMRQLRSLQLQGNPFRNPRPAVLSKGTPALLEYLRDRIPQ